MSLGTPPRLVEVFTFGAANEMIIDDLGKLIEEAAERAKAAQIAEEAQTKPPPAPPTRTVVGLLGARAGGFFA